MKNYFLVLLFTASSSIASAQLVFDPSQKDHRKREKSIRENPPEKPRLGISAAFGVSTLNYYPLPVSLTLHHKNKQFSAGCLFLVKKHPVSENIYIKNYGYNLAFRYIFPQNRTYAKAFIPIEFEHVIGFREDISYFNHITAKTGPGGSPNPGYSFNLNTSSKTNTLSLRSGLGIFIWLHDCFNIQIQATAGGEFSQGQNWYSDEDNGNKFGSEIFKLKSEGFSAAFMVGFGFRF